MDFSKFDKAINIDELKKDIQGAESNSGNGDYKEVPVGKYEVRITKLELAESKKHDPMVVCWFKIINGEFKNSLLFMNQVINRGFQIHIVNDFLRSLDSGLEVKFESYEQYNQLIMDVLEAIDGKLEYALEYGENKGFNTFKITEIFEVE